MLPCTDTTSYSIWEHGTCCSHHIITGSREYSLLYNFSLAFSTLLLLLVHYIWLSYICIVCVCDDEWKIAYHKLCIGAKGRSSYYIPNSPCTTMCYCFCCCYAAQSAIHPAEYADTNLVVDCENGRAALCTVLRGNGNWNWKDVLAMYSYILVYSYMVRKATISITYLYAVTFNSIRNEKCCAIAGYSRHISRINIRTQQTAASWWCS